MGSQVKNTLIGVFVIFACTLFVSTIMFLRPSVGDGKQTIYVRFSNINSIGVGTRVLFAGKPVGEVVAVNEIFNARAQPTDTIGSVYFYQLTLHIDSHIKVYDTDEVSLQTSGLLGEKSIVITPKAPPKGVTPKLITNQPIYAESIDPIQNAFMQLSDLADDMQDTFRRVTEWIDNYGDAVGDTIHSIGDVMTEAKTTIEDINNQKVIASVKQATDNFSNSMCKINTALDQMQQKDTFNNIGDMVDHFKATSESVESIAADIANGTGTIGRLIQSDGIYLDIQAVMNKANTLMNDINHYGILFHLNKQWQRQRLQRVNLLESLSSPGSFKSYFEEEVDQINTAMARLSMLLCRAEENPKRDEIMQSELFKKDFAELLRQAEELSENLRLFNDQLTDMKEAM